MSEGSANEEGADADRDLIDRLRARLRAAFAGIVAPGTKVALIGAPGSANCGDHALWLGEEAILAEAGAELVYCCTAKSYDRAAMESALGDGVIMFHGGNDGAAALAFLGRVVEDFPRNQAVICPHAFGRDCASGWHRETAGARAHAPITIFARSKPAQERAIQIFDPGWITGAPPLPVLAPDMAFALGPLVHRAPPRYDILWLARTDRARNDDHAETAARLASQAAETFILPDFEDGLDIGFAVKHRPPTVLLTDWSSLFPANVQTRMALREMTIDARARAYLKRGLHMLSLGSVLITDRLHGHIMALLLGIPHVLLDDGSGKNFAFHESWTRESRLCRTAEDASEAWNLARAMKDGGV